MRVMCIKDGTWVDCRGRGVQGPAFGEMCMVYSTYVSCGDTFYKLIEYGIYGWDVKQFIPIDDSEETIEELETESQHT